MLGTSPSASTAAASRRYQGVPVGTIKRHVTGKGNADKAAVIAAVRARGFNPADDNEADALAILLWATETQGGDLAKWLDDRKMQHVRGAPYHPQTQGKIERWHQTLKNRILLENYYLPGDLEAQIGDFVAYYNHLRYHESIANLTPADVYFGRGQTILLKRKRIKRQTIENRRLNYRRIAA